MSITPNLRATARAAYRELFRTAATTFKGDDRVLQAFRQKVREETRSGSTEVVPSAYEERVQKARDVAQFLKRNVVQGVRIDDASTDQVSSVSPDASRSRWRLRITEHTELGSNDSLKNLSSTCTSNRRPRNADDASVASSL